MDRDGRYLIVPSETRFREFDAKLLLACHAAERGWRVIVGSMKTVDRNAARLSRGVYIGKSVTSGKFTMLRLLRRLGHIVTAWDEEGLVYASPEVYRATKVDARALNSVERLFAWGEANAEAWRGHPDYAGTPISVTGNPRADLLRPELRGCFAEQAERLRRQHGEFILINTNFSRMNHLVPAESRHRRLLEGLSDEPVPEEDPRVGTAAHKERLFRHFLEMAPALARRFPDRRLILRPHPSEDPETWRRLMADCPNAEVMHEGSVVAWLMSAAALVHNGCTTAVESFLLDRPAIAYRPVVSERYDHPLPNALSVPAFGLEELFARVGEMLDGGGAAREEILAARRDIAREHVASHDGPSACERILDALDGVLAENRRAAPAALDRIVGWAGAESRRLRLRMRLHLAGPQRRNSAAYLRHMFPRIEKEEVVAEIRRFAAVLGRFDRLRVDALEDDVFVISQAD